MLDLERLDFAKRGGLVTVVTQDARSGAVLMVAHADHEALELTIETGEMHYRARSRGLWRKGAVSGNTQRVVSLSADCDGDAVLARVIPSGPACHTGSVSCFGDEALAADAIAELDRTIAARATAAEAMEATQAGERADASAKVAGGAEDDDTRAAGTAAAAADPLEQMGPSSYTRRLLFDRNLRLKKLGEEAAELAIACADDDRARALEEGVDLVYHTLVALRGAGVSLEDLRRVVAGRAEAGTRSRRESSRR